MTIINVIIIIDIIILMKEDPEAEIEDIITMKAVIIIENIIREMRDRTPYMITIIEDLIVTIRDTIMK